jgi:STAM-binding protein
MKPRSRTPSPYDQSPPEVDRAQRERVDVTLRDMPRRQEQVYSADGARPEQLYAREDDANRRREWEEEGRRQIAEQRRQEQDGILRRQQEADHAAQAARLGHPTGQNRSVTAAPAVPLSASFSAPAPSIQYPSVLGPAPTAPVSSGPTNAYMQMPLESPTRCVIFLLKHPWFRMFSRYLMGSITGLLQTNLIERETPLPI